ncbi:MAG: sigma-70 family RNA polymerase sigma factor [Phycisphaerales bacterium]|nr:sigma-70 family RNA polymerase sigma factor [Phycisphaerales bacterium]
MNKVTGRIVDAEEQARIERAASGDRTAQRELFDLHRDAAYAAALRITGRHEDALDAVQDSFIKAFENLATFQRDAGFRTWLVRIASNRSLDLLRARKVRLAVSIDRDDESGPHPVEPTADDPAPGSNLERDETLARMRRAITALPEEHRVVFTLFADAEMSYGEIAAALEIPIGTVMSRLFHARKKLAAVLTDLAPAKGRQ